MSGTDSKWHEVAELHAERIGERRLAAAGDIARAFDAGAEDLMADLTLYKFAAKMIGRDRRVLDLSCGSGLGTWVLARECGEAFGVEPEDALRTVAEESWPPDGIGFGPAPPEERFDGVVALRRPQTLATVLPRLDADGVVVLADPDLDALRATFVHVFVFSVVGELIRPGQHLAAERTLGLACVSSGG
jgi:hypothetical protein